MDRIVIVVIIIAFIIMAQIPRPQHLKQSTGVDVGFCDWANGAPYVLVGK